MSIDLAAAEELFAASTDATVGLEEEFAILDPASLDLVPRFEELRDLAIADDPVLAEAIAGELISSRDRDPLGPRRGRPRRAAPPARRPQPALRPRRVARGGAGRDRHPPVGRLSRAAQHRHRALPPRGRRPTVRREAQQHVLAARPRRRARPRPRGPRVRPAAPGAPLAAQHQRQLALPRRARQRVCTRRARRSSPRASRAAASPTPSASWEAYRDYIELLIRTDSIVEYTQVWWSIRPHLSFGTVEVRICDAQTTAAGGRGAQRRSSSPRWRRPLRDVDEGVPFTDPARRLIEENFWRAIRYGQDGTLLDLDRGEAFPAAAATERLLQWTAPVRAELGIEPAFPALNGAQRQRRAIDAGAQHAGGLRRRRARDQSDLRPGGRDRMSEQQHAHSPGSPPRRSCGAAYEQQLKQIRVEDVLVQTVLSLINLGSLRAGLVPGNESEADPAAAASRPSRPCGRCCPRSSPCSGPMRARSATRSRGCRWSTRAWPAPAAHRPRARAPSRRPRAAPQGAPPAVEPGRSGARAEQRQALGSGALTAGRTASPPPSSIGCPPSEQAWRPRGRLLPLAHASACRRRAVTRTRSHRRRTSEP